MITTHLVKHNIVGAAERPTSTLESFADRVNLENVRQRDENVENQPTLICFPICVSMTTFTNALDIVIPCCVVIKSSNVCAEINFCVSASHL